MWTLDFGSMYRFLDFGSMYRLNGTQVPCLFGLYSVQFMSGLRFVLLLFLLCHVQLLVSALCVLLMSYSSVMSLLINPSLS